MSEEVVQVNVAEIDGPALDWVVAKCEGYIDDPESWMYQAKGTDLKRGTFHPSKHWAQGGLIIERERVHVAPASWTEWVAAIIAPREARGYGPAPLIAAMRCYVASKMGPLVEVPADLMATKPSSEPKF